MFNTASKEVNREQWLGQVMDELRPYFKDAGYPLPKNVRVTCGFPSQHARSAKIRAIGESWTSKCSADKTFEVLVSPIEDRSVEAAAILAHELAHIADDHQHGHRGRFVKIVRAVGLEGPPRRTYPGDRFKSMMKPIIKNLGQYPHAKLDVLPEYKKQTTRLIKVMCPHPECGYAARVTRMWIDMAGTPLCANKGIHKNPVPMIEMMAGIRRKPKVGEPEVRWTPHDVPVVGTGVRA